MPLRRPVRCACQRWCALPATPDVARRFEREAEVEIVARREVLGYGMPSAMERRGSRNVGARK